MNTKGENQNFCGFFFGGGVHWNQKYTKYLVVVHLTEEIYSGHIIMDQKRLQPFKGTIIKI